MKIDRLTRVNELLRREISEVLYRLLDPSTFDLSALTVTHVITSSDLRHARVLVSIRGHEHERSRMMSRLQGLHAAIQEDIADKITLKYTPRLHFAIDESIAKGDHVLSLLSKLGDAETNAAGNTPDTPEES
jgi:ribosome-binding factor A